MEIYSSLDLIGQVIKPSPSQAGSFISRLIKKLINADKYVSVDVSISSEDYVRTIAYCSAISKITDLNISVVNLVDVIFNNAINDYYSKDIGQKLHKLINHYLHKKTVVTVVNHMISETYVLGDKPRNREHKFKFDIERDIAFKGEALLLEIDQIYGGSTTLETFISIVWSNFIRNSRKMDEKMIITHLTSMLEEQF